MQQLAGSRAAGATTNTPPLWAKQRTSGCMSKSSPRDPRALRITQQANGREGRTFDLMENECRLILSFAQREGTAGLAWHAVARTNRTEQASVFEGEGKSRREALDHLATIWRANTLQHDLPAFDWSRMAEVLQDVRGLD